MLRYNRRQTLPAVVTFPTGWLNTDTVHYVACPRCGAAAGVYCETPVGRLKAPPHCERIDALREQHPTVYVVSVRRSR